MIQYWKKKSRSLCLGLVFAVAASVPAYADTVLPPAGPASEITGGTPSQTGTALQSGGTVQGGGSGSSAAALAQPVIEAQGAVLYDATHNRFLFEKNADTRYYPASITKLMTALLVAESCSLDDMVTFSQGAVTNLESGAVTLKVRAGDRFTVRDCLYGLLLKSANEVANGLAEHVSGSVSAFADRMNQKAAALGCTGTHFANPNGLNHAEHYTTARDMALIARAAFENQVVRQVASTVSYDFPATASVPTVRKLTMGHKMLNPAGAEYYAGIVGGKTGYTSLAGNTLVTCAERDGTRLIAVILKSRQTHYSDTKKLLDYGFELSKSGQAGSGTGPSGAGTGASGQSQSLSGTGNSGQSQSPSGNGTSDQQGPASGAPGQNGNGFQSQTPVQERSKWIPYGNDWKYVKEDGTFAAGELLLINGAYYYFKADGWMARDWELVDGTWRWFSESGAMGVSCWVETGGYHYYVDDTGALFTNGVTPGGYRVDANGVWIP